MSDLFETGWKATARLEKKQQKGDPSEILSVLFQGVDLIVAHTLRRVVMSRIETMAVDSAQLFMPGSVMNPDMFLKVRARCESSSHYYSFLSF